MKFLYLNKSKKLILFNLVHSFIQPKLYLSFVFLTFYWSKLKNFDCLSLGFFNFEEYFPLPFN